MRSFTWRSGFSALEGLIVLAFFGLLITLGALSLNSARARTRDAVRLSDMSALRAALHVYWQQTASYPTSAGTTLGQPGVSDALTLDKAGFVSSVNPQPPVLLQKISPGPSSNEYYWYKGTPSGYTIRFETERDTALGNANIYYLHSTGFDTSEDMK
jgi:type II secretory pathway pseudopilin PulG